MYNKTEVRVIYKGKIVLSGGRDTRTGLWHCQQQRRTRSNVR